MRSVIATYALLVAFPIVPVQAAEAKQRARIGLALEGGGALGLAHVGLIEWFEQNHIPIDYIAGTSMGGAVAGFYASGMSAEEMRQKVEGFDWNRLIAGEARYKDLAFRRKEDERELGNTSVLGLRHGLRLPSGLNSGQALDLLLSQIALPYGELTSFNDLPTPFRCVATDLVSAKQKVFDSGSLAEAMRATMSIPGLYEPVLKLGKGSKTHEYVDGGLLNNLPVDLVKAMGADIVIAVYLATDPYDPTKPHSALGVLSRSLSVVMAANERHNIETADILVSVNVSGLSTGDFSKTTEIINRGLNGTEQKRALLSKFALDDSDWGTFIRAREAKRKTVAPPPQFVAIDGLSESVNANERDRKTAETLRTYFNDQIGRPFDPSWIENQIGKITALGVYDHISYMEQERDGKPGLVIHVEPSNSRPPTVQPSVTVDGSDYLNPRFNFGARVTASNLGGFRSELQTDFAFGSTYAIGGEFFHPFTPLSRFFIAPHARAETQPLDFYHRSHILAFDRELKAGGGIDLGYSIANTGEVRMGYDAYRVSTDFRVGEESAFPILTGQYRAAHVSYAYNHVDDGIVPHSGLLAKIAFQLIDSNPGTSATLPALDLRTSYFQPLGARNTAFVSAEGGTTFNGRNAGIPLYFLGGAQRLSAYGTNELFGNQYYLGRVGFLKQFNASIPFADGRVYFLIDYELAKMYGVSGATELPMDVNAGLLVRTVLGPLFVGGSSGDAGHRKWYFQFGRVFN